MEVADHLAALGVAGELLAGHARTVSPTTPVPTCEGWSVADLLRHLGGVHRWAADYLRTGRAGPTTADEQAALFEPVPDGEALAFFEAGHAALLEAFGAVDESLSCWVFLPAPSPLAFWARRQAHETAIHGADVARAAGATCAFPAAFAADGIDELLVGFLARRRGRLVAEPPVAFGIAATDTGDTWTVEVRPDRRVVTAGLGPVDCLISGPASELYLTLWNRRGPGAPVELGGDAALFELWRSRARVRFA